MEKNLRAPGSLKKVSSTDTRVPLSVHLAYDLLDTKASSTKGNAPQ